MRERRVGTLTLGCMLLVFGGLFLVQTFTGMLGYEFIFRFWPLVFIMLGLEVLFSFRGGETVKWKLDLGAIFLLILLMGAAMGMAGADFCFQHMELWGRI